MLVHGKIPKSVCTVKHILDHISNFLYDRLYLVNVPKLAAKKNSQSRPPCAASIHSDDLNTFAFSRPPDKFCNTCKGPKQDFPSINIIVFGILY